MAHGMDVNEIFAFHPATKVTGPKHDEIRTKFRELAQWVEANVPGSPEQTLAIRKLQEGMMFSNAAVAIHTPTDYEETPAVNPNSGATWEPGGGPTIDGPLEGPPPAISKPSLHGTTDIVP